MTSRTDVPYVGPIAGQAMILVSDNFSPVSYYCFVVDSSNKVYLSLGAFGDSFYGIYDSTTYKLIYVIPSAYTDGENVQIAVYDSIDFNNLIGYLSQQSGSIVVSPSASAFPMITNDPSNYPSDFPVVLSGVRYQTASSVNVPVIGYTKTYTTGLYGGLSSSSTNINSSSMWITFVQNSITTPTKCSTLNSITGQIPSTATIAQCYALSGKGYDTLSTCNNMMTLNGFNDITQCSGPVYYYSTSDCGGSYTFTNFNNASTSVLSSYGSCDSGGCSFDGTNYVCDSGDDGGINWLLIAIIGLVVVVILIIIIAVAVSASKKKKKQAEEQTP